ncbi:MAG: hypothetical protein B7Y01_04745, partial [Xanthobacter sp. 17-67-6]
MSTDAGDARSGFLSGVFSRRTSGRERLVVGGAAFAGGIVVAALEGSTSGGITAILAGLAAIGIFAVVSATMRLWSG